MDAKISNTLLTITSGALVIGGLILLLISIFGETKDNWALNSALAAIFLSNLFNLIRLQRSRKVGQNNNAGKELHEDHHE